MPFCSKCGAQVAEDSKFCPSCGTAVSAAAVTKERREKGEKEEKGEKQEKEEKSEKHEKEDRSGPLVGGLILILLGGLFLLQQADMLPEADIWPYFLFGIGCILLIQALLRSTGAFRGPRMGSLIGGLILCLIGLGGMVGVEEWWPLLIIAFGVIVIVLGISAVRRSPKP